MQMKLVIRGTFTITPQLADIKATFECIEDSIARLQERGDITYTSDWMEKNDLAQ